MNLSNLGMNNPLWQRVQRHARMSSLFHRVVPARTTAVQHPFAPPIYPGAPLPSDVPVPATQTPATEVPTAVQRQAASLLSESNTLPTAVPPVSGGTAVPGSMTVAPPSSPPAADDDVNWRRLQTILHRHQQPEQPVPTSKQASPGYDTSQGEDERGTSEGESTSGTQPLPLEAVWPVQRTATDGAATFAEITAADKTTLPKKPSPSPLPDTVKAEDIDRVLRQVAPEKKTDSPIDVIMPTRPRPQPVQRRRDSPLPPTSAADSPETIETDIGPLPVDLWQLLGEAPPQSALSQSDVPSAEASTPPSASAPAIQRTVPSPTVSSSAATSESPPLVPPMQSMEADPDPESALDLPQQAAAPPVTESTTGLVSPGQRQATDMAPSAIPPTASLRADLNPKPVLDDFAQRTDAPPDMESTTRLESPKLRQTADPSPIAAIAKPLDTVSPQLAQRVTEATFAPPMASTVTQSQPSLVAPAADMVETGMPSSEPTEPIHTVMPSSLVAEQPGSTRTAQVVPAPAETSSTPAVVATSSTEPFRPTRPSKEAITVSPVAFASPLSPQSVQRVSAARAEPPLKIDAVAGSQSGKGTQSSQLPTAAAAPASEKHVGIHVMSSPQPALEMQQHITRAEMPAATPTVQRLPDLASMQTAAVAADTAIGTVTEAVADFVEEPSDAETADFDIEALSRQVYQHLKRKLAVEHERGYGR